MSKRYSLIDPVSEKFYDYETRDAKEDRLFEALKYALKDECPPDISDYLCMMDESEEQRCEDCWIRWATKDFKKKTM